MKEKRVKELSKTIASSINFDENGDAEVSNKVLEKSLPEGLDKKTFRTALKHSRQVTEATTVAALDRSKEHFEENKGSKRTSVHASLPEGHSTTVNVKRKGKGVEYLSTHQVRFNGFDEIEEHAEKMIIGEE